MVHRSPLRQGQALHSPKGPAFQTGIAAIELIDQILDFVDNGLDDYHAAIVAEYPYCEYDEDALAKMDANLAQLRACPSDLLAYDMYDYMYGFDELNGFEDLCFIKSTIHTWLSCGGDGNQNITIQ